MRAARHAGLKIMSDEALINFIVETLEKSQRVKIWDSRNEISLETIAKIKEAITQVKNQAINDHILKVFGAPR